MNPDALMDFMFMVAERHRIWEQRQAGQPQLWTLDETLATRKFTNVYRVLDPGSQFVLTDLDEPDISARDLLSRLFMYRYTNLPSTWHYMRERLGHYPLADDMTPDLAKILHEIDGQVFSGAYMIIPQPGRKGDKIDMVVQLAEGISKSTLPFEFLRADSQAERWGILSEPYGVGPFLAMQILTDWGYTSRCSEDREDEFVVAGPGSSKGLKLLGLRPSEDSIRWVHRAVLSQPDCPSLDGRPPSLMDSQNCLCEYSKYVRGPRSGQYRPQHPGSQPSPVLPAHWRHQ